MSHSLLPRASIVLGNYFCPHFLQDAADGSSSRMGWNGSSGCVGCFGSGSRCFQHENDPDTKKSYDHNFPDFCGSPLSRCDSVPLFRFSFGNLTAALCDFKCNYLSHITHIISHYIKPFDSAWQKMRWVTKSETLRPVSSTTHFDCQTPLDKGWWHGTMDGILALHLVAPGSILGISKNFSLDVAEIYRWH